MERPIFRQAHLEKQQTRKKKLPSGKHAKNLWENHHAING
jgi:hypothetical protein